MAGITYLERRVIYENPKPHLYSKHGYFPGIVKLDADELLVFFMLAEAFEASNGTTYITRSKDAGKTWQLEGPVYDKSRLGIATTDTLKPTVLRSGSLVAIGYRFHRNDPEQGIGIPETDGTLNGDDIVSFSSDRGKTWSFPRILDRSFPELIECSGPCIELASGDLLEPAGLYKLPTGTNPSGQIGVLLRSVDKGHIWTDNERFLPNSEVIPWETRICEMQPGRIAVLFWAYHHRQRRHLTNHVVVSHNNGASWSEPIDTGHQGQASNLLWLGDDLLATIHAHRSEDTGIYVRLIDFRKDRWTPIAETKIYGAGTRQQTSDGQSMSDMFTSLKFGQPSLIRIQDNALLACHWAVEDGQSKVILHRLQLNF